MTHVSFLVLFVMKKIQARIFLRKSFFKLIFCFNVNLPYRFIFLTQNVFLSTTDTELKLISTTW